MAYTGDYIPARDAEFDGWFENLNSYVQEKTGGESPAWTHVPKDAADGLFAAYTDWHRAYAATLGAHTAVDTKAKNDANKAAAAFIRPFVAQYLKFAPVTNEDRTAMGLHNHDDSATVIPPPATRAAITDIRAVGGYQIKIWFRDEQTPDSRAVPYGFNGCLLNFAWGAERDDSVSDLKETALMTHSPWTLTLPPEARKSFLSCAARWQNKKGALGPWGDIQHVVVG
ncbi:hypothetical protein [Treponema endosymbiont of Eucomonympha sp.]|uniref:hypothetical protein n=1 Tax=Treponema endosymbiont of Eucomonympha sp. TaxID=1580831 RepID=UPI000750C7F3|nr:hypothetical protein [Treponema endosymbiont of Eucomonympha sp.]